MVLLFKILSQIKCFTGVSVTRVSIQSLLVLVIFLLQLLLISYLMPYSSIKGLVTLPYLCLNLLLHNFIYLFILIVIVATLARVINLHFLYLILLLLDHLNCSTWMFGDLLPLLLSKVSDIICLCWMISVHLDFFS